MLTLFHSAKGGSGTTTVAALAAIAHRGPTLLVDLDDELPTALGAPTADRPGVVDWISSDAPPDHLADLVTAVAEDVSVIATRQGSGPEHRAGAHPIDRVDRWLQLASWCRSWSAHPGHAVMVDVGTRRPPEEFVIACDDRLLVTRSCYLALRAAPHTGIEPTGTVLIAEPGRSLARRDVERATGAAIVATINWDPAIAHGVDSGLLAGNRRHRATMRELGRLTRSAPTPAAA